MSPFGSESKTSPTCSVGQVCLWLAVPNDKRQGGVEQAVWRLYQWRSGVGTVFL
jgi:hypothetical protein